MAGVISFSYSKFGESLEAGLLILDRGEYMVKVPTQKPKLSCRLFLVPACKMHVSVNIHHVNKTHLAVLYEHLTKK